MPRGMNIDGLFVRAKVPNTASISASLNDYFVLKGIRAVPMSEFGDARQGTKSYVDRVARLVVEIADNKEINPLIVVLDDEGYYVLEGAHRIAALQTLGVKHIPATVVLDLDTRQGRAVFDLEEPEPDALSGVPLPDDG